MSLRVGQEAPDFTATAVYDQEFKDITLSSYKGKWVVLFFYPLDFTFVCPTEITAFSDEYDKFSALNTEILGVSRDSVKSHENFKQKQSFPFELLSDPDEKMCKSFDVIKLKSMYGKQYLGVDRSTFLVSEEGKIIKEWRSVKVKGHVEEVLEAVENL